MGAKEYFLDLTTRRAAHLFMVAFAAGLASIIWQIGLPWVPPLVVVVYGGLLVYAAKKYSVPHAEMTNNSPYFLGFLFFLVSLLRTFSTFSESTGGIDMGSAIRQLGSALWSTIVGLPLRQLLFAYSPAQADQDVFFRTLEEEIRRSASEFRRSQTELLQLLKEFCELRRTLFSEEEEAARKYVRALEKSIALFEENLTNYPTIIAAALNKCSQSLSTLKEKLRELAQAAESIDVRDLNAIVTEFQNVKSHSAKLAVELSSLQVAVQQLRTSAGELPGTIREHLQSARSDFDTVRNELRKRIDLIEADISQVDKVLTEFVDVAKDRIEAIK